MDPHRRGVALRKPRSVTLLVLLPVFSPEVDVSVIPTLLQFYHRCILLWYVDVLKGHTMILIRFMSGRRFVLRVPMLTAYCEVRNTMQLLQIAVPPVADRWPRTYTKTFEKPFILLYGNIGGIGCSKRGDIQGTSQVRTARNFLETVHGWPHSVLRKE
jgi:hypothetical protein